MTLLDYGYPVYDILLISSQRPLNYSALSTGKGYSTEAPRAE